MAEDDLLRVDVLALERIMGEVRPIVYKISSLLEGHYTTTYTLTSSQQLIFMELGVSGLLVLDYLNETIKNVRTEFVLLKSEEVLAIGSLIHALTEATSSSMDCGLSLMEH